MATVLAKAGKYAGAHVNVERACPQLYEQVQNAAITEAILDVVMHLPGCPLQRLIDVTVRCPHVDHYISSSSVPGVAADAGVQDKLDRYGDGVMTVAYETYGRLAHRSVTILRQLASDLSGSSSRNGPGHAYNHLRWSLERAMLFEMADITALSLGSQNHNASRFASR